MHTSPSLRSALTPPRPQARRFALRALTASCALACLAPISVLRAQEIPPIAPPGLSLPRITLLSMGGTIASQAKDRLNITNYGGKDNPRVDPEKWVKDLPDLALYARITTEDFRPPADAPAGGGTSYERLYAVAKRLQELANDPNVDGVVVTHGTNTMAETAWFMNLTVNITKPVVYVGSQRPWSGLSGDGPLNLLNAVRVAATPEAAGKGVLHAMNQNINSARDVTKLSAYRMDTFRSIDLGVMGVADPDKVVFFTAPTRRHTHTSEFNINSLPPKLPDVEIAYAYTEAPGYILDAMVTAGVKGIIVDGTGAGSPTGGQTEAIKKAQAAGVIVAVTARTHGGRVQDTPRRRESGIIPADNLMPEKARMLLQLALAKTQDPKEIKRIFDEY
ncbi:MAG: asparaginase [Opitutaceae bacterium]|nr:asparaginase [Opitutaceae bacterium]